VLPVTLSVVADVPVAAPVDELGCGVVNDIEVSVAVRTPAHELLFAIYTSSKFNI